MAVQEAALDRACDGIAGNVTHLSLHTDTGGTTGTDELSGGNYSRAAETADFEYNAATGGVADLDESVVFGGGSGENTVTHLGFWDGGTWLGSAALSASKTLTSSDTLTITSAPITVAAS